MLPAAASEPVPFGPHSTDPVEGLFREMLASVITAAEAKPDLETDYLVEGMLNAKTLAVL